MSEGKLDHLSDKGHLFSTSTNIIIANLIKFFLIFTIDRISFGIEHGAWSNYSKIFRLGGHYFKLNRFEISSDNE